MQIEKVARQINRDCERFNYFFAYGTIKETLSLWEGANRSLLCDIAQTMVEQAKEVINGV